MLSRATSQLDDDLESVIHQVIGLCISVHRELGPGLLERIYRRAVCIELNMAGLVYELERTFPVMYRGQFLCDQRVDLIVAGKIVLELKAIERLAPVHQAQVMSYLRL